MAQFVNIFVGLATALIGYIIGRFWQRLVDWLPHRRARIFLGPIMRGQVQIVASRFSSTEFREPTGLVGGGDAFALRELATFFGNIGFKQFDVVYVDERTLDRRHNLILFGSQGTNQVTLDVMDLVKPNVTIVDPGPGIPMEVHDLAPGQEPDSAGAKRVSQQCEYRATPGVVDYGIIVRARNPFSPGKAVIIIAGAYGYGSWAGADLIQQDVFLRKCEQLDLQHISTSTDKRHTTAVFRRIKASMLSEAADRPWAPLECIFKVRIFDDRPLAPEIIVFRPLL